MEQEYILRLQQWEYMKNFGSAISDERETILDCCKTIKTSWFVAQKITSIIIQSNQISHRWVDAEKILRLCGKKMFFESLKWLLSSRNEIWLQGGLMKVKRHYQRAISSLYLKSQMQHQIFKLSNEKRGCEIWSKDVDNCITKFYHLNHFPKLVA